MTIRIQIASPVEVESFKADLVDIYRVAFRDPPYAKSRAEVEEFSQLLSVHAVQPGFRLIVAIDSVLETVVGFTYGRTVTTALPWHDVVEAPLRSAGLGEWLEDAYQVTELAVTPAVQGRGVGGRLHDRLLRGLAHKRAILTTMSAESAATRLYLNKGWTMLLNELIVPGYPRTYRIMGLDLPYVPGQPA